MKVAAVWVGLMILCGLCGLTKAACPDRNSFSLDLQKISSISYDSTGLTQQRTRLHAWLKRWEKCYEKADSTYISALNQLAYVYNFTYDYQPAIRYATQAIALYGSTRGSLRLKTSDYAKTCYRLGVYLDAANETEKSLSFLLKAFESGKIHPDGIRWASAACPYITYSYYVKGDFEQALLYASQGEHLAYMLGSDIQISKLFEQKAQVLQSLGRFNEAKNAIEKAILLVRYDADNQESHAGQERLLGVILQEMGDQKNGLKHLQAAFKLARLHQNPNLSDYANALGLHFYRQKNYQKAISYFKEAYQINKSQYSKSVLFDHLGLASCALGKFDEALRYHQKGLTQLSVPFRDTSLTALPRAATIRSEPQKEYFLLLVQDKAATWLTYARKTSSHKKFKLQQALHTFMLADSMIDFMRWELSGESSKLFWRKKTRTMYEQALETCFLLNNTEAAFHFFEKSRAVLLSDKLNELNAAQRLSEDDSEQEKKLSHRIRFLQNEVNSPGNSRQIRQKYESELLNTLFEQEKFIKRLETTNPQYFRYKYDSHIISPRAFQEQSLKPTSTLPESAYLSYFVGDSSLFGLCIQSHDIALKRLDLEKYRYFLHQFKPLLISRNAQNKQFTQLISSSSGLYECLLKPFGLSKGTRLIISPDGEFLPFGAFSLSPTQPDFLIRHHAISYVYSARFLEKNESSATSFWPPGPSFLGVAPIEFPSAMNLASLSGSDKAITALNSHFHFPKNLIGKDASRQEFMNQAQHFQIVQLITHADADSLEAPTLFFADSTLALSDLPGGKRFQTQLMVLSACKTGSGTYQRGEGVFSFARGFLALGIPSTLTTLWNVENQTIYELNQSFYEHLATGLPLDIALQKAQIAWLTGNSRSNQLPFAWAGIVLIGQTRPVMTASFSDDWFILIALGFICGLIWGIKRYISTRKTNPG
ncbi:CHAT domain-containing protein [Arundinibacter roseus]|uniref:CHAT domain-containing protein n=1 Tax=Arundinibacter roseus TaxID=2070510 RepID=A0A4R4K828_9BACT|nr:CHAT domain-containing tetratricopeptide repeat protein [Arundinibacter roseus]TDB63788.1 CHAT domain-containing protein [Arundinibacter roseus]